ncbi:MAG: hypothetical protein CMJ49_14245 [Planctomycetaceae bacterium]|nr:hypothetical protein [Planctomycetaceae bacterium]
MGQPAPGGGNTGVIPRPGESIVDDLRDQFDPRVPRTQPGGGHGHKDDIEIAPWSWGEAQIGRYVKELENMPPPKPEPAPTSQPGGGPVPTEEVAFYFNKISKAQTAPVGATTQPRGSLPGTITYTGLEDEPGEPSLAVGGLGAGDALAAREIGPRLKRRVMRLLARAGELHRRRAQSAGPIHASQVDYFLKIDGIAGEVPPSSRPAPGRPVDVILKTRLVTEGDPAATTQPGGGHLGMAWDNVHNKRTGVAHGPTVIAVSHLVIDNLTLQTGPGEPPMVRLLVDGNRIVILNHASDQLAALAAAGIGEDHPITRHVAAWRGAPTGMIDVRPPTGIADMQTVVVATLANDHQRNGRETVIRSLAGADRSRHAQNDEAINVGGNRSESTHDEKSSLWMRVSQVTTDGSAMAAGTGIDAPIGFSVRYLDQKGDAHTLHLFGAGDPDRPLILGNVPNPD